eukprot:CAMPEP_0202857240 /NCGR_PEP_ID=MMETSP1391-20130828/261_1 /ASSEMBLY_ACC=CAM_ASM_000867 /TAXON_ID=1034604 /ORGANISM="Chlamydomonas leiostraca, Strain SAG 11-49" /LENGTH=234 /DNA_ID=CAMNT_0049536021 /DNA_START=30 /DNA_END=734 /DNA_ORIENTATION=-
MMLASRISSRPCKAAATQAKRAPAPSRLVACRAAAIKEAKQEEKKEEEVVKIEDLPDPNVSTKEVQKFLSVLVNDTNIAQLQLQVGSFQLKVKRRVAPAAPAYAPVAAAPAPAAPTTVVVTKAPVETMKTLEETIDESLVSIPSPKVGIFRRGKYAGGKRVGKANAANVGDQVKRGQVLGYVEQLGTFVPVESPQAGEIVKFFVDEGMPVEYQQSVLEMAPFFGGHIIGDSKFA